MKEEIVSPSSRAWLHLFARKLRTIHLNVKKLEMVTIINYARQCRHYHYYYHMLSIYQLSEASTPKDPPLKSRPPVGSFGELSSPPRLPPFMTAYRMTPRRSKQLRTAKH